VGKIRVTLVRSPIGQKPKLRATVRSLGLRRLGDSVEHEDTPDVQGMVAKVGQMVRVEPAE